MWEGREKAFKDKCVHDLDQELLCQVRQKSTQQEKNSDAGGVSGTY